MSARYLVRRTSTELLANGHEADVTRVERLPAEELTDEELFALPAAELDTALTEIGCDLDDSSGHLEVVAGPDCPDCDRRGWNRVDVTGPGEEPDTETHTEICEACAGRGYSRSKGPRLIELAAATRPGLAQVVELLSPRIAS